MASLGQNKSDGTEQSNVLACLGCLRQSQKQQPNNESKPKSHIGHSSKVFACFPKTNKFNEHTPENMEQSQSKGNGQRAWDWS